MKYCAYLVVTTILCCLSFVACSNEEEKFEIKMRIFNHMPTR